MKLKFKILKFFLSKQKKEKLNKVNKMKNRYLLI